MTTLLKISATVGLAYILIFLTGIAAFVANAILNSLGRSWRPIFISGTVVVEGVGAYAASVVIDIIVQAFKGQLPTSNIVWSFFAWSLIALCSLATDTFSSHYLRKRVSVPINRTVSSVPNLASIILPVILRPRNDWYF